MSMRMLLLLTLVVFSATPIAAPMIIEDGGGTIKGPVAPVVETGQWPPPDECDYLPNCRADV
jgi:hypothetical protein